MRVLYHFARSPFSRRVRLVLAHKGLDVELRDARGVPKNRAESDALFAGRTIPVLVDDGAAVGDSTSIATYLDRAYPTPPLWPSEKSDAARALAVAALTDQALEVLVDIGTRTHALRDSASWSEVKNERLARVQGSLEALGSLAASAMTTLVPSGWCGADIWLFSAVDWLAGLPARAGENANIDQLLSLGWTLPPSLARWADAQRTRDDVRALTA